MLWMRPRQYPSWSCVQSPDVDHTSTWLLSAAPSDPELVLALEEDPEFDTMTEGIVVSQFFWGAGSAYNHVSLDQIAALGS